jgi:aldoxime dehydratase
LAWWQSLAHLEAWAHRHPTHLAILKSFGELATHFAPDVTVVLGHEVYVVPKGGARAEYLNCHERTGLLPFFGNLATAEFHHLTGR